MSREVANFRTFWKATTFSSVLEPIIYLLAFGLGLGSTIVNKVDGLDYVEFVGTGMVATAVIFSSALPAMFGTFVKHRFQRTYDAILAAPVDVEELVTAEMLWIGIRAGLLRLLPAARGDGLRARPGAGDAARAAVLPSSPRSASPPSGSRSRGRVAKIDQFNYVTTLVHHAAVPGRRHVLPDRPAARGLPGRGPVQPAPPARRAGPRTPASASRRRTCCGSPA